MMVHHHQCHADRVPCLDEHEGWLEALMIVEKLVSKVVQLKAPLSSVQVVDLDHAPGYHVEIQPWKTDQPTKKQETPCQRMLKL